MRHQELLSVSKVTIVVWQCTVDTLFFLVLFVALCFLPSVSLVPFQLCVLPATEYKQAQTVLARYNTKVTVLVRNPEV